MKNSSLSCHWKSIFQKLFVIFLLKYEKSLKLFAHSQHICILNAQRNALEWFNECVSMCIYREVRRQQRLRGYERMGDIIWMRKKSKRWKCLFFAVIDFPSKNIWHNCLFFLLSMLHFQGFFFWWWLRNHEVKF